MAAKTIKMNNNYVLVIKNNVEFLYIYLGIISRHKEFIQCGHVDS